jgi:hypothetical protein
MDPELMHFLLYVLAKFLAYAIWCGFGIKGCGCTGSVMACSGC